MVALFVPEIRPEIQKKSRNPEIQRSRNPKIEFIFGNLKSPEKSGRFDTPGSPVAIFVPEIGRGTLGVTEKKEKEKKDWSWSILVVGYDDNIFL